jgi:hypothetical protein
MQIWLADPLFGGAVTRMSSGTRISTATQVLADIDGVAALLPGEDEPD